MNAEKKKMSTAKIIALIVSIALHAALIYYLGQMAIDYALPKGEVTSYEMDFNKGEQTVTTNVDVVDSAPAPATPPAPKPPAPKVEPKPVPPKIVEKPARVLPPKEASPVEDHQGDVPVATEIPEETPGVPAEEPQELAAPAIEPPQEVIQAPVMEPVPVVETPKQAEMGSGQGTEAPAVAKTSEAYGTPSGIQSDTVLTPYGSNRAISYPTMARFKKLEGVTVVHYTVSAEGAVTDVQIVQSSGHAILDDQAVDTIKNWKFKPTGREGVYERPIRYSLKGDATEAPSKLRRLGK